jgi:hypothetical protein
MKQKYKLQFNAVNWTMTDPSKYNIQFYKKKALIGVIHFTANQYVSYEKRPIEK